MKHYTNITCGVLTPKDLSSREHGELVLRLLARHSWVLPSHVGNTEPIRTPYVDPESELTRWEEPLLWRNDRSGATGSVWFGRGTMHSCLFLHVPSPRGSSPQEAWINFLVDACGTLEADIGYVHLTTDKEMSQSYEAASAIATGMTTHDLQKGVPNLCWAMLFGKPYQAVSQRFRSAPSLSSFKELPQAGQILVQLTSSMASIETDYRGFEDLRQAVKIQVGEDFLWSSESGAARWTPHFSFDSDCR